MTDLFATLPPPPPSAAARPLDHVCRVCGSVAHFGFGPPAYGRMTDWAAYQRQTVWFCRAHRPDASQDDDHA